MSQKKSKTVAGRKAQAREPVTFIAPSSTGLVDAAAIDMFGVLDALHPLEGAVNALGAAGINALAPTEGTVQLRLVWTHPSTPVFIRYFVDGKHAVGVTGKGGTNSVSINYAPGQKVSASLRFLGEGWKFKLYAWVSGQAPSHEPVEEGTDPSDAASDNVIVFKVKIP
ncbi:hypothetical protein NR800_32430 [Corallococcus interemptor]|uniref:hypothetical protein n=1 Tax=Corallococcus TaxID=83461 RepID=UPI001CBE7AF9|nr:hypothetical protein [Corallococcus sp. AS-1-12]MBZ4335513.1 hypothetical protein [Corallococcus sp. AS-1-12]